MGARHRTCYDVHAETRCIATVPAMVFDVSAKGDDHAPLVLMLHGFGVSRYFWNAQVRAAAAVGYFAVAPNQRGYAASAGLIQLITPAIESIASSGTRSMS
jgi:pimeloyl-ACP methyl ester carboxylesterase